MRSMKFLAMILVAVLALVSCSRNPEVAKRRYLESGNKYYEKGKFKEARIMYKDSIQKDRLFGPAYYRLGLTAMKLGSPNEAVGALRRAIELIKPEDPDHWDAVVKLSDIYLAAARNPTQKQFLAEVDQFAQQLLKRDPKSFDGHRLTADLKLAEALDLFRTDKAQGAKKVEEAIEEYHTANRIKPGQAAILMQLARANAGLSRLADAEKLYREVISLDKAHPRAYFELYGSLAAQNRPADAEQVLKDAFQASPKQFDYLKALALHYSAQGRREEMLGVLQQIKSHAKDFDQAYLVVGDFYLRLNDGEGAIREYREGIDKDAAKKTTYQKRIIEVLMRQGKRSEAADLNSQILKESPNDTDAKQLAATFLLDRGEINRALTELQSVVTRAPENPVARFQLGRAHAATGNWEQARQNFQKAVDLSANYIQARLALAQLHLVRNEYEAALKAALQIVAFDKGNIAARLIESAALMGQKKLNESRALLEAMIKVRPGLSNAHLQLGAINLAEKKYKEAEDSFRKAHQSNPADTRGLMGVVETAVAQGKGDAALQMLRAEADRNPNRPEIRLQLGNAAVRLGRFDEGIAAYQQVLGGIEKDSAKRGDLLLRIGEVYRIKGDYGNAVNNLQQARAIRPENAATLSTLGLAFDQAKRWNEARQVYEAALKVDSNNGFTLNNLAFLIAEHGGDLDDALAKAQRAKQIHPNLAEISDTLGWIYLKKGMTDQAVEIFQQLVTKTPNHATFRYHLAMAFHQKGDRTRAVRELREALKNNPANEERDKIRDMLQKLGE